MARLQYRRGVNRLHGELGTDFLQETDALFASMFLVHVCEMARLFLGLRTCVQKARCLSRYLFATAFCERCAPKKFVEYGEGWGWGGG